MTEYQIDYGSLDGLYEAERREYGLPISKEINENILKKELAYHEASHLVFYCLLFKHGLSYSFMNMTGIEICTKERTGRVRFNYHNDIKLNKIEETFKNEFDGDLRKHVGSLLANIAGYTSCKFFLQNNKYYQDLEGHYIGHFSPSGRLGTTDYYNLENVPDLKNNFDYSKIEQRISFFKKLNSEEIKQLNNKLTNDVISIMNDGGVKTSIGYVKNILRKNDCTMFEGEKFEKMLKKINDQIQNVDLEETFISYQGLLN